MGMTDHNAHKGFYSSTYVENAFWQWYRSGRPSINKLVQALPEDERGNHPSYMTVIAWCDEHGWEKRADELDAQVKHAVEIRAVEEKVEMLRRHSAVAKELINRGMDFLNQHGLDKSADALRAVISGVEIERTAVGMPEALERVSKMSDEGLLQTLEHLMGKVRSEDVQDVAEGEIIEHAALPPAEE